MKERIIQVIELYELSPSKFADELGIQRSGISHILSGRNNPSLDLVQKILQHFPDINPDWIVTGKGAMLKSAEIMDPNQITIFDIDAVQTSTNSVQNEVNAKEGVLAKKADKPISVKVVEPVPVAAPKAPEALYDSLVVPVVPAQLEEKLSEPITTETPKKELVPEQASVRKIERIVIFYTDGTFTAHNQQ